MEINTKIHIHDEALEGSLPRGFPAEGYEGKVRNIYTLGQTVCIIVSDRISAFDQVSPTLIPGKGVLLNDIASEELQAAGRAGIPTWLEEVPENNPRAAVGHYADVLPVEMIYRNYLTGSMWREYDATGAFPGISLSSGLKEWHKFAEPKFTPSTKAAKDVNFDPANVEQLTGVTSDLLSEMKEIGSELFSLGTKRAAERDLVLIDAKYEMGITADGKLIVIDEVHTPDSARFAPARGFAEAISRGQAPKALSKEFLRGTMLKRAGGNVEAAKRLMVEPLPHEIVGELSERYHRLHQMFVG